VIEQVYRDAHAELEAGRPDLAEAMLRRALQKMPSHPDLNGLMGMALRRLGRFPQAEFHFQRAIAAAPQHGPFHNNYGNLLLETGRLAEARRAFETARRVTPGDASPCMGMCSACIGLGDYEAAIEAGRRGVALAPGHPRALANLGAALVSGGLIEEAVQYHRAAIEADPDGGYFVPGYLATLHYDETLTPEVVEREHRRVGPRVLAEFKGEVEADGVWSPEVTREPERRLRVGYLSSDFRSHSCAMFIEPIIERHDRSRFEVRCYFNGEADGETPRIKAKADQWRSVQGMGDVDLVALLRAEKLDVLVELNGHTEGGRLEVVARRVAPVQVTYLGYPNITGVPNIDARLVDAITDPAAVGDGVNERLGAEALWRLPRCFVCFRPREDAPVPIVADSSRPVRFGSFNAGFKTSRSSLRLWGRAVATVPGAVLVLKNKQLADEGVRRRTLATLAEVGLVPERVTLLPATKGVVEHLASYGQMDIALDCFPYNGTTTTCEALWMGVPVVVRRGAAHVSRVGESLLTAVGLPELIAADDDEFVRVAAELAGDRARLAVLRAGLRERMRASPLCDQAGMTAAFEGALRGMWRVWCGTGATG